MSAGSEISASRVVRALPYLLFGLAIYALWGRLDSIYDEPPLWLPLLATCMLCFSRRLVPVPLLAFWLTAGLSLSWSLGPGNTLVAFQWESLTVAAFAAGAMPVFGLGAIVLVLIDGFLDVLSMSMYGTQVYLSGSISYVVGALGATMVVLALNAINSGLRTSVMRGLALIVGTVGLTVALSSGSRAVYFALLFGVIASLIWIAVAHGRHALGRLWLSICIVVAATFMVEHFGNYSMITPAWQTKGGVERVVAATEDHGVLTQRLRLWDQGLAAAREYPFGTGLGTYSATAHAFQSYPMLWSSSPHNYLVLVMATGGWLRVFILMSFIALCVVVGLKRKAWPWTIAGLTLLVTTMFDVTGDFPRVLVVVFFLLGAGYYKGLDMEGVGLRAYASWTPSASRVLTVIGVFSTLVFTAWWFLPCHGPRCAVDRYLGYDNRAVVGLREANPQERDYIFDKLRILYPRSLWVLKAELAFTSEEDKRLALVREIATTYPFQSPENFRLWSLTALAIGDVQQALGAIRLGLSYFPEGEYPYGEKRITQEKYDAWIDDAYRLRTELEGMVQAEPNRP